MYEPVAKLLCPEKSMIFGPVTSGSKTATLHLTKSATCGPAKENGWKWPQKGDFAGQMSFATASHNNLLRQMIASWTEKNKNRYD
ncbi:MAG: hypothetical protein JSR39_08745 [Verrucomicrobia bacterium]|nr:hypothetical protein [Verrucomicrobiota bacterium]